MTTLLEAAQLLHRRGYNVTVRLAGWLRTDGALVLDRIERTDPGLVQFLGELESTQIREEICAASVCICPFPSTRELDPVQPVKLLEYMSAGKPVVASALPGIAALIQHGISGVLVPPDDPNALAAAIGTVLDDARLRTSLSRGARERVKEFDISHVNDNLLARLSQWL
jgi:glycosyltransferase involved in cell wall biosynthesis